MFKLKRHIFNFDIFEKLSHIAYSSQNKHTLFWGTTNTLCKRRQNIPERRIKDSLKQLFVIPDSIQAIPNSQELGGTFRRVLFSFKKIP